MDLEFSVTAGLPEDKIVRYHLFVSRGSNDFQLFMPVSTNTSFYISNVIPDKYRFYVRSENDKGVMSVPSNIMEITSRPSPPVLILKTNIHSDGFIGVESVTQPNTNRTFHFSPPTGNGREIMNPSHAIFFGDTRKPVLTEQTNTLMAVGFLPPKSPTPLPLALPPLPGQ
jgi:hypothetical protein